MFEAINRCDVDARKDLYQGVVLTGGTSLVPGLRDRLERTLTEAGPTVGIGGAGERGRERERVPISENANPIFETCRPPRKRVTGGRCRTGR